MSSNVSTTTAREPWALTTRSVVFGAIFGAMTLALGAMRFGFIPLPNASGAGTVLHIPTILGAIVGGPLVGMFCGAIFGVMALLAFPSFGPFVHLPSRILIGLFSWLVYNHALPLLTHVVQTQYFVDLLSRPSFARFKRVNLPAVVASMLAAIVGSLTNTIITIGTAVILELITPAVALTFIPQAITELIAAAVLVPIVVGAVEAVQNVRRS